MASEYLPNVMSPEAERRSASERGPAPASSNLATRLDTLENKTVYLINNGFGGSAEFMLQLQKWFAKYMPSVTTIARRKSGHVFADDTTDLWDEIKGKGDAVVYGVAG
jgi:hypothetical protein